MVTPINKQARDTLLALADYCLQHHEREAVERGDSDDAAFFRHLRLGTPYPPDQRSV